MFNATFIDGGGVGFIENKENNIRDKFEKRLLIENFRSNIPVLGVCRGVQFIADYFGAKIKKTENHVEYNFFVQVCLLRIQYR